MINSLTNVNADLASIYRAAGDLIADNGLAKHCMIIDKRTERGRNSLDIRGNVGSYRFCIYAALVYSANRFLDVDDFKPLVDLLYPGESSSFEYNRDIYSMKICQWNNLAITDSEQVVKALHEVADQLSILELINTDQPGLLVC